MSAPTTVPSRGDAATLRRGLGELASRLQGAAQSAGLADVVAPLLDECRRPTRPTARVVVAGAVKRGKSALVNALLGRPGLVPVDTDVATGIHVAVSYGERERAAVHIAGTEPRDRPRRDPGLRLGAAQSRQPARRAVRGGGDPLAAPGPRRGAGGHARRRQRRRPPRGRHPRGARPRRRAGPRGRPEPPADGAGAGLPRGGDPADRSGGLRPDQSTATRSGAGSSTTTGRWSSPTPPASPTRPSCRCPAG